MSFSSSGDNVSVRRPNTPPKKPDRMAGDRMQTGGTENTGGQVTRPDEKQGFFGSSDVTRRGPGMAEDNTRGPFGGRRPPTGGRPGGRPELERQVTPTRPPTGGRPTPPRPTPPRTTPDRDEERETPNRTIVRPPTGGRRPPTGGRPFFFGPKGPFGGRRGDGGRRPPGGPGGGYGPRSCPDPSMLILMSDGSQKKAGDLMVGDLVKTYHEKDLEKAAKLARSKSLVLSSGEVENNSQFREQLENAYAKATLGEYKVEYVDVVRNVEKIKLIFDESEIICSLTHKFLVDDSWKEAKDMIIGDEVSGKKLISTELVENGDVIHITVKDAHTYICEGLLSHNKRIRSKPNPDRPTPPRPTPPRPTPDRGGPRPPFGGRPTPDRGRPTPDRGGPRPPFGGRTGTRPENMPPRPTGIR